MLRIAKLTRIPTNLRKIPIRGGVPGWDRPDPPPSVIIPNDRQLTDQQIVFGFNDRNMPEFFTTNPEVYEGDTFRDCAQSFLKNWAIYLGAATLLGALFACTVPPRAGKFIDPVINERYEQDKQMNRTKQWLSWAKQNPVGLNVSTEFYPRQGELGNNTAIHSYKQQYDTIVAPNAQVKSYLTNIKAKCAQKVHNKLHPQPPAQEA